MKSTDEILGEMDAVQAQYPVLNALDSTSEVSFFLNLKKFWATLVQMIMSEWETFQESITAQMVNTSVGSISWYVTQVKQFQLGDQVSIINGRVAYDVVDLTKQVIKQATCSEDLNTGRLTFRAAKMGAEGLVPLISDELEALKAYVGKIKYAGVLADVISMEADQLKLVATIKVDRQVFRTDGALLADTSKFPIRDAIANAVAYLPYNSVLNNTDLTDVIQAIKGVNDFSISQSFTRRPVSSTWIAYNREVVSLAGHMTLHNDSQLNYTY